MLSKEELEYIEQIEKALKNNENFYWQEDMYELIEIIKKQYRKYQKIKEKLEEEHTIAKTKYSETLSPLQYGKLEVIEEILEIVKGVEELGWNNYIIK